MQKYKNTLGTTKTDIERYSSDLPYSNPVYRRKYYEIRKCKESKEYYEFEMEDTRLYQFDKINDCVKDVK